MTSLLTPKEKRRVCSAAYARAEGAPPTRDQPYLVGVEAVPCEDPRCNYQVNAENQCLDIASWLASKASHKRAYFLQTEGRQPETR